MANIEKIVSEEVEKARPILESCKSIYFSGSSNFNDAVEGIVKGCFGSEFYETVENDAVFLIINELNQSDKRITFFWSDGFIIYSITSAFWSNYKIKIVDPSIENELISFDDIKSYITTGLATCKIDTKSRKNDIALRAKDIFDSNGNNVQKEEFFKLLKNICDRINNDESRYDILVEEAVKAMGNNEYTKAIEIYDELLSMYPDAHWDVLFKARAINYLGDLEKATKFIKIAFDKFNKNVGDINNSDEWDDNDKSFFSYAKETEGEILKNKKLFLDSVRCYNDAIRFVAEEEEKQDLIEERDSINEMVINNFINLSYNLRKVIFVDSELSFYNPNNIVPIEISKIKSLKFPPSHPVPGQLYVGHPFKEELYFPIEDYENYLFESQVMELSWLLKSLGATKIKTEHIMASSNINSQDISNSQLSNNSLQVSAGGSGAIYSGDFSNSNESSINTHTKQNKNNSSQIGKRMNIDGVFKPKYKPHIPDDLIWFEHNEIWQSLAKQRLEGGLESYDITLSTKNVEQVSERELKNINKEYKQLLKGSAGAKIVKVHSEINSNSTSNESRESLMDLKKKGTTELRILVDFAPIDELTEYLPISLENKKNTIPTISAPNGKFSEIENEFIEFLNDTIEDGKIEKSSRKFLEKRRIKLGISEERAEELENTVLGKSNILPEEEDYIELLSDSIEEGIIADSARKFLEKRRIKLGISEERAEELEEIVLNR